MTDNLYIPLENRSVIKISGADAKDFLQGIITNDINKVTKSQSIYSCLLTPQGKFLFDFFISELNGDLAIDCASSRAEVLIKLLTMYKLRREVEISDISNDFEVAALIGENVFKQDDLKKEPGITKTFCKGVAYIDPRTEKMFARSIIDRENNYQSFHATGFSLGTFEAYENLRIEEAVPDGEFDLIADKSFPLHYKMEEMQAIDFQKGCYVGQEVTARSKHRGKIRKTLLKVASDDPLPPPETAIKIDEKQVGTMCSSSGNQGLALLEKDVLSSGKKRIIAGDIKILIV